MQRRTFTIRMPRQAWHLFDIYCFVVEQDLRNIGKIPRIIPKAEVLGSILQNLLTRRGTDILQAYARLQLQHIAQTEYDHAHE